MIQILYFSEKIYYIFSRTVLSLTLYQSPNVDKKSHRLKKQTLQVSCPPLALKLGHVRTSTTGSLALFTCHHGYSLKGPPTKQCLSGGVWSDSQPVCERVFK